jgi:hypothetical protein
MLHKALGLENMTSIEGYKKIVKRCKFNLPFDCVKIFPGLSSEYIPSIDKDVRMLAWFDYDFELNRVVCDDIVGLLSSLRPWSIVIITVDLEKPRDMVGETTTDYFEHFWTELPTFVVGGLRPSDFNMTKRTATIQRMIDCAIQQGVRGRTDLSFEYMIQIAYADGHKMLTIGGMIADGSARQMLSGSSLTELWYIQRDPISKPIEIPRLIHTRKEMLLLEQCLPGGTDIPKEIGLAKRDVEVLRRFYRYWPSYFEGLV